MDIKSAVSQSPQDLPLNRPGCLALRHIIRAQPTIFLSPSATPCAARRLTLRCPALHPPRSALCPPGTRWLFPRRDGSGPVHPNHLSARLQKRIRAETGLVMNVRLFSHLAAMIWLGRPTRRL